MPVQRMSSIGPIEQSFLLAAQAQKAAARARDKEDADDRTPRRDDLVDLRVHGVITAGAVKPVPKNDSEQAAAERDRQGETIRRDPDDERPRIDVRA